MEREIEKLVEYRTVRHSARSEASTYFTNQEAEVFFRFANPIICLMLQGRKIMRVDGSAPFEFLPGEAMLVAPGKRLDIVFPDAALDRPTECMCIEIDRVQLDDIVERINEHHHRMGDRTRTVLDWSRVALLRNERSVNEQLARLLELYNDQQSPFRDILIDLGHQELVVKILQAQARDLLMERPGTIPDNGLDAAAAAICKNPERHYSIAELARIACMSEATLFRHFKARFGVTPARFATAQRIRRAQEMLSDAPVTNVALALGFSSAEHFSRVFRQATGQTPSEARKPRPDLIAMN
jgi:AraC-like DNA-binding protein